jgi:hypothetical protein
MINMRMCTVFADDLRTARQLAVQQFAEMGVVVSRPRDIHIRRVNDHDPAKQRRIYYAFQSKADDPRNNKGD